jgi:hypothetical protein
MPRAGCRVLPSPGLVARERVERAREPVPDVSPSLEEQREQRPLLLPSGQETERIAADCLLERFWRAQKVLH